jgi:hypothetical protein
MVMPSSTPEGILTDISSSPSTTPLPSQNEHGRFWHFTATFAGGASLNILNCPKRSINCLINLTVPLASIASLHFCSGLAHAPLTVLAGYFFGNGDFSFSSEDGLFKT